MPEACWSGGSETHAICTPQARKLPLKSYLMRSGCLVQQLTHCLPAGGPTALFKICRVLLCPRPCSFRQELPATGAVRADVRVHPADAWWRKQWLMPECSCFSGTRLSVPQTDPTWPGPLVSRRSRLREVLWCRPLAYSLTLWCCDCHPPSRFLFSLLEKSGSVCFGSDDKGKICCCTAQRHGWMFPQSQAVLLICLLIGTAFMRIDPAVLG